MYCKQCGFFVDEKKDKFCINCGMKVEEEKLEEVSKVRESKNINIMYYASEAISVIFFILAACSVIAEDIPNLGTYGFLFFAMINIHKIMITKMVLNNQTINGLSILLEKLVGFRWNLYRETSYIYENARKRNIKLNIVLMLVFLALAQLF